MTLLDFVPDLLVDKDRTRANRRYVTKTRHHNHGHYRESRDRPCTDPVDWNRRMRREALEAAVEPPLQMELLVNDPFPVSVYDMLGSVAEMDPVRNPWIFDSSGEWVCVTSVLS
jgi:hypothetical protein